MQPSYPEMATQLTALQAFAASANLAELQRLAAGGKTAKRQSLYDFAANPDLAELQRLAAETETARFQSLRDFAASADLRQLQKLLTEARTLTPEFNLFDLLNLWWQEDIHSRMLTWLLNPQESHGAGDHFLKNFLLQAGCLSEVCAAADWSKAEALREWYCVVDGNAGWLDILILNHRAQFLCAIENKILSPEGGRQLTHYRKALENGYRNYTRRYLFLSPGGMQSQWEDERQHWTPLSYTAVLQVLDHILASSLPITPEVRVLLSQYAATLRRNIVTESTEMQQLARQIYLEHWEAVDLIFANKPNYVNEAKQIFKEAIAAHEGWELDKEDQSYVRFRSADWDEFPATRKGTGLIPQSQTLLFFQFYFRVVNPSFMLVLSPGPDEAIREKLFDAVRQNPAMFRPTGYVLRPDWNILHEEQGRILDDSDYGISWDDGSVRAKIMAWVADFARNRFPAMNEVIVSCLHEYEAAPAPAPEPGQ